MGNGCHTNKRLKGEDTCGNSTAKRSTLVTDGRLNNCIITKSFDSLIKRRSSLYTTIHCTRNKIRNGLR